MQQQVMQGGDGVEQHSVNCGYQQSHQMPDAPRIVDGDQSLSKIRNI